MRLITTLIALTLATTNSAKADVFSMTPELDKLELSTGLKLRPADSNLQHIQQNYKWDNEAPFLVSLGILAVCVTIVVIASGATNDKTEPTDPIAGVR